ncbi:MAG: hypothetical protein V3S51_09130 [Dehalococcoidia bacterium]
MPTGKNALSLGIILLLIVSLVSLVGCTDTYSIFSKYGFSFQYPSDFTATEFGIEEEEANDTSGAVQVRAENGGARGFQVSWMETWLYGLEYSLQNAFAGMEKAEGIEGVDASELLEGEKDGHQMLYQYYTLTTNKGDKAYGIAAAFYYSESHKLFTLVTTNSTVSTWIPLLITDHNRRLAEVHF